VSGLEMVPDSGKDRGEVVEYHARIHILGRELVIDERLAQNAAALQICVRARGNGEASERGRAPSSEASAFPAVHLPKQPPEN
jgi:hypothetical protein